MIILNKLIGSFIDMVFPANCPVCGTGIIKYPVPICGECRNALITKPVPPETTSTSISGIISCHFYTGIIKKCIKLFKYNRYQHMTGVFETLFHDLFSENVFRMNTAEIIIPVPIHRIRRRRRGFNQAELIARALSKILAIPVAAANLVKTRNTPPQTGLSGKERINNLQNSFSVLDPLSIAGKSIILADDVMTTGATLETCAAELLDAGAGAVFGFTLARTGRWL